MLKFDGLYASKLAVDPVFVSFSYLRFYQDGTVLETTVAGARSADIMSWFHRSNDTVGQGHYSLSGNSIEFAVRSESGVVDYWGKIVGDELHLEFLSHINGNRGNDEYSFIASS